MEAVAAFRPLHLEQKFSEAGSMLVWANKLEVALSDAHGTVRQHQQSLDWFRRVVNSDEPSLQAKLSLDVIVADLQELGRGSPGRHLPLQDRQYYPPDIIAALFPGADHPPLPVDCLVKVDGAWEPAPPPDTTLPGSMVVCKPMGATFFGTPLPFNLGMALPGRGADDALVVAWWVPSRTTLVNFKRGQKPLVVDVFAPWRPLESLTVEEARAAEACLPGVLVQKSDVLIINVDLDTDKVPYEVFDRLRLEFHIDVTSISISATLGGNAYRAYVQMM